MRKKQQILVIGLGRFGSAVATTLAKLGHEVAAVDLDVRPVQRLAPEVTQAMSLDATDPDALLGIAVQDFDIAVVAIGDNVEASILTTANLVELGCKQIVAKALTDAHARILDKVGAHRVVFPEWETGVRIANSIVATGLIDYLELSDDYSIAEVRCPPKLAGRSLRDADVRKRYNVNVLVVKSSDGIDTTPAPDRILAAGDILIVAGSTDDVDAMSTPG